MNKILNQKNRERSPRERMAIEILMKTELEHPDDPDV